MNDDGNQSPCARSIFIVTRNGHYIEPIGLASSWLKAELRRVWIGTKNHEIAAFNVGLTSGEKLALALRCIPVIDIPYSLPECSCVSETVIV